MVRLEVEEEMALQEEDMRFPFQNGSIRSERDKVRMFWVDSGFHSKMVRLEV